MNDSAPHIRRDLEFFPVQEQGRQLVLIRDNLGLVEQGKVVPPVVYLIMTLLDGTRTVRDLQTVLTRENGGVLVGSDEVERLLTQLDESFLLDSLRFRKAKDRIVDSFTSKGVRPCSHCGAAYPNDAAELETRLGEILNSQPANYQPEGKVIALIAPHIDFAVGHRVYASVYKALEDRAPSRVVLLGVGHQMGGDLFSLTDKDFETPLGVVSSEKSLISKLREAGGDLIAPNDFAHRSEHSIEFQLLFLKHLHREPFTIVPILCGSLQGGLPEYTREAYLEKTGPFLTALREILMDDDTLLLAGVDFSHIGPKFGHELPATHLENQTEAHDRTLLSALSALDPGPYWEESARVKDQFNVCGFSAMACLLEVIPPCGGHILDYQIWHEEPTRSAVTFAGMVFTA